MTVFPVLRSEEGARRLSHARQLRKEKLWVEATEHTSSTSGSSASEAGGEAGSSDERQLVVLVRADTQAGSLHPPHNLDVLLAYTCWLQVLQSAS